MRSSAATQFGGHSGREELELLELPVIIHGERVVGVVCRGTRGENWPELAGECDKVRAWRRLGRRAIQSGCAYHAWQTTRGAHTCHPRNLGSRKQDALEKPEGNPSLTN